MKTLDKDIIERRDELIGDLAKVETELANVIERCNGMLDDIRSEVGEVVEHYNALVEDARRLRDDAQAAVQGFLDQKSEKWKEGERGQLYATWVSNLESLDLADIEVDLPEEIERPSCDALAELEEQFWTLPE
jgi:hypothetical protein